MKKTILILAIFSLCSFMFARPIIQQEFMGVGLFTEYKHNPFNTIEPDYLSNEFAPFEGFAGAFMWEFNSSADVPMHFYTGIETGLEICGFPLSVLGGFTYKLFDLNWAVVELNTTIQGGILSEIFEGYVYGYGKASVDVVMMGKKRRGLYGGIGLVDFIIPDFYFYKDYGTNVFILNYAGLRVVAGFRF